MTPAPKHVAAILRIETLDGNGLSLSFPTRGAAEIAFQQIRTGSDVQHCALLTHLREGPRQRRHALPPVSGAERRTKTASAR